MPKSTLVGVLAMLAVALVGYLFGVEDDQAGLSSLALMIAMGWTVLRVWIAIARYRGILALQRLDREGQALALSVIPELHIKAETARRLAQEPPPDSVAPVERFEAPKSFLDLVDAAFWLTAMLGAVSAFLLVMGIANGSPASRSLLMVGATGGAFAAGYLRRTFVRSQIAVELSPYAITEIHPSMHRRALFWKHVGWLRLARHPSRIEVIAANGRERVAIPYNVQGFYRALSLAIQYGGFDHPNATTESGGSE